MMKPIGDLYEKDDGLQVAGSKSHSYYMVWNDNIMNQIYALFH